MDTPTKLYQQHGVMMQLNGIGVLIIGKAGIGKSSFALELLHHGHQLIADDVVEFKLEDRSIHTSCPDMLKGLLHTRELGVIDVENHFGTSALCNQSPLDVAIELTDDLNLDSSLNEAKSFYTISSESRPLLRLNINNPVSCYHRLLTWLNNQNLPDASVKLIERQQQALVNTHS